MPQKIRLCDASEVAEGQLVRFSLKNLDLVVVRLEGQLSVLEDRCGHMGAPMSMGKVDGCTLVCPLHDAAFDMKTGAIIRESRLPTPPPGAPPNPRARLFSLVRTFPLRVFPVSEDSSGVFAEVPDGAQG